MTTQPVPNISMAFASLLSDWLALQGLERSDLSCPIEERSDGGRISLQHWRALLNDANQLRPDHPVGLEIGGGIRVRHVGTLGYLVLNSETLGEALETYLHCEHQFYGINFARLERAPGHWRVSWLLAADDAYTTVVDVAFAALFSFMRQRFGPFCRLREAALPGSEPLNVEQYGSFFGCPVRFGSKAPGLDFVLDKSQQRISIAGTGDFEILRQQQHQAFDHILPASDEFLRHLRRLSLRLLPYGEASLIRVADEMHMSSRTLQRRLSRYGVRYQELLDGLREQLAKRYLTRSELSLAQLSQLLGFSEQSVFQRAFKLWTGVTPGYYRQEQRFSTS